MCILNDSTRNLIDKEQLEHFRPCAVLINASRGGVVNESALYEALKAGKIFAAACDTHQTEPPTSDNPLFSLDNYVGTPHIGACTEEAMQRVGLSVVQETLRHLGVLC